LMKVNLDYSGINRRNLMFRLKNESQISADIETVDSNEVSKKI
jgi:hypothetical protein